MPRRFLQLWLGLVLAALSAAGDEVPAGAAPAVPRADASRAPAQKVTVFVLPVRDEIGPPVLYILRRGLKEAIERKAGAVVLDMKTPGGALDTTFEIMEDIEKFPGLTMTYVDDEAVSAGAFIAATTQEIWFAPKGVIGAAAPVDATGKDIDETMRMKVVSYLRARVRAVSEGKGFRGQVIEAMIDKDYELKIGDVVIKPKGGLLSLTDTEAYKSYGSPPQPLLAAGLAKDLDDLLRQKYGADGYQIVRLEVTWSERLAQYLNAVAPVLLGLGIVCLFIEFKTPGFGFFGFAGIALLGIVFLGHFVAGFSGHEPMLVFALGVILVAVEIFFFPGVAVVALSGVVLMLGSLVWAMADIWPGQPVQFTGEVFLQPLLTVGLGLAIAAALALVLARFLPKGWFFQRLAISSGASGAAQIGGVAPEARQAMASLVGSRGTVVTGLFPGGRIEIGGRLYQAKLEVGSAPAGTQVVVQRVADFGLVVEVTDP